MSPPGSLSAAQTDESQDSEAIARRHGFEKGFDAGQQDALRLAQMEIAPEIEAFGVELNQLGEYLEKNEERTFHQINKMALAIAENILGGPAGNSPERLAAIKSVLKKHMVKFYQLKLTFNSEDMEALSLFMAGKHAQWQACDYIQVDDSDRIQSGSLQAQPGAQGDADIDVLVQSLDNLFHEASTK